MQPQDRTSAFQTIVGTVTVSGLIWLAIGSLNRNLMAATTVTTGIELVYLPAGVRLLIILIFGFWGALGIFLTNPILFITRFGAASATEVVLNAAISAFVPLLVVKFCARFCGIDPSLLRLRAIHLPIFALAVSIVTPLAFNVQFSVFDRAPYAAILQNIAAMSFGDFLGCLFIIVAARLMIAAYRAAS